MTNGDHIFLQELQGLNIKERFKVNKIYQQGYKGVWYEGLDLKHGIQVLIKFTMQHEYYNKEKGIFRELVQI